MGSKIIFRNETEYTLDIAFEAGEAFWEIQPAYKKKAKRFKVVCGITAVTFLVIAAIAFSKSGIGIIPIGALAMAATAIFGFFKGESLIRNSAKNFRGMNTKVSYGVSDNFFFVLNREVMNTTADTEEEQQALEAPADEAEQDAEPQEAEQQEETALVEQEPQEENEDYSNEYEDEFLSLDDLLVCVVTENLYILIWERPYYILDRRGFVDGKDEEFRAFIEEKAEIVETQSA